MTPARDVPSDVGALLDAVEAASPVRAVDVFATELARIVGAVDVTFLIADLSGDTLIRLPASEDLPPAGTGPAGRPAVVPLAGSPYEQAVRSQRVFVEPRPGAFRVYAPVTERGDALGVLELTLPEAPDDEVLSLVASAAHALAYVVIANRRHTDLFERGQRTVPFSLAAEIQRRLLPASFTCEAAEFTLAGWLEPASDVGGDTFDYSVEHDTLHVSLSDAMGHTVAAAQLATLAVGSLRNSRRSHAGVVEQAQRAHEAIGTYGLEEGFVSALLLRVDLRTGTTAAVNAGHPVPYLVRDGRGGRLELEPDLPLGMLAGATYREQTVQLRPGDRLVLLTDGILERNASTLDVVRALHDTAELHPREVVHTFAQSVLEHTRGQLEDDATVLCLDWYGPEPGSPGRTSRAGATQSRATGLQEPPAAG